MPMNSVDCEEVKERKGSKCRYMELGLCRSDLLIGNYRYIVHVWLLSISPPT